MAWWHRKGQRVVCVDVEPTNYWLRCFPDSVLPSNGSVYTIRDVVVVPARIEWVGFRLEEITNPDRPIPGFRVFPDGSWEALFNCKSFRPVQHRDTSATVAEIIRKAHDAPADLEVA